MRKRQMLCTAILIASMVMLTSCSTTKPLELAITKAELGANLKADCEPPDALANDSPDAVGTANINNAAKLRDCGERHKATIEAIDGKAVEKPKKSWFNF